LDSAGSEYTLAADFCVHGNKLSNFTKRSECPDQLHNHQLLKNDSNTFARDSISRMVLCGTSGFRKELSYVIERDNVHNIKILNAVPGVRIKLSNIKPNIKIICEEEKKKKEKTLFAVKIANTRQISF
jgi:Mn-containing catalase